MTRVALIAALLASSALCMSGAAGCGPAETPRGTAHAATPALPAAVLGRIGEGERLFFGRGGCASCHMVGSRGTRVVGPNLGIDAEFSEPFAIRAPTRRPGLDALAYAVESIVDPDAFTVPGFAPGVMKRPDLPPLSLTDGEIASIALFVASIGAPPDVSPCGDVAEALALPAKFRAARDARTATH